MLVENSAVRKAIDLKRELDSETAQLAECQEIIAELEAALVDESGSLGTFQQTRRALLALRSEALTLADSLVKLESDYITDGASIDIATETLRQERAVLADRVAEVRSDSASKIDRYDVYLDQVRAVQSVAFKVDQTAKELIGQIAATREYLASGQPSLSEEELATVRSRLEALEAETAAISAEVSPLWGDVLRQQFTLLIPVGEASKEIDEALATDLSNLRAKLRHRRSDVLRTDGRAFFARLDGVWDRAEGVYQSANATLTQLEAVEREEIARIRVQLGKTVTEVERLEQEVSASRGDALDVGIGVTRVAFGDLADFFSSAIERADIGIVDVYWARKMETAERMDSLKEERAGLEDELTDRFGRLYDRMGD
jgi:uncharacterized protein (UPF0335 family)